MVAYGSELVVILLCTFHISLLGELLSLEIAKLNQSFVAASAFWRKLKTFQDFFLGCKLGSEI